MSTVNYYIEPKAELIGADMSAGENIQSERATDNEVHLPVSAVTKLTYGCWTSLKCYQCNEFSRVLYQKISLSFIKNEFTKLTS